MEHVNKQGNLIVVPIFFTIWIPFFLTAIFTSSLLPCLWPSLVLIFCGIPQIIDFQILIKPFEIHSAIYVFHSTQRWKSKCWMKLYANSSSMKIWLDEPKNVWRRIWSRTNFIQYRPTRFFSSFSFLFFVFLFFVFNFLSPQTHPTFRPTSKIWNIGWNVGCICIIGLKTANVMCKNKVKISKDGINVLTSYIACYQL